MNNELKIMKENGRIEVYTPYNADFVKAIKQIGGARFNGGKKCWMVSADYIEDVREIMTRIYGHSDQTIAETVDVRIEFEDDYQSEYNSDIRIGNQTVCYATGRDSGAKVGVNAVLVDGRMTSGGSAKYWRTCVSNGSVFKIKGVTKSVLEREMDADGNWCIDGEKIPAKVTIISTDIDVEALKAEKERLEKRLAEIERLLG